MKKSMEEVKKIVEKLGYKLLREYYEENSGVKKVVIQDDYGYMYNTNFDNLRRGYVPRFVDKSNISTLQNISLWLKKENKSFILLENNVYKGNKEKLFFQCLREECQEIFDMNWACVYGQGQGCPFCAGKRVGEKNNLAYLRPELAKEWDYHKNEKTPEEYTENSGEKVSWICSKCGHPWDTFIFSRSRGTGCPECSDMEKESKIASELKEYFKNRYNAIPEYKIFKNPKTGMWLPYDIYIPYGENPELNGFYIEVHGEQHYKIFRFHRIKAKSKGITPDEEFSNQKGRDKLKKKYAKKNGRYIEIDLRKIKTVEEAIEHIEEILKEVY